MSGVTPHAGCTDVHSHLFPTGLPDFASRYGEAHWPTLATPADGKAVIMQDGKVYRPVDPTYFSVEPRLSWMDESNVGRQVVSPLPVLLTYWAPPAAAHDFARHQNEAIAAFVSEAPDRLTGFGTVALQDPELAIRGLEEVRALGLAGVEIGSHAGGMEYDRPEMRPFFEAAAEMGIPLLLHALEADGLGRVENRLVRFGVGVPADTGLTGAFLFISGLMADLPSLRMCLCHGGGSFFWSLPRIRRIVGGEKGRDEEERLVAGIKSVFVDTAGLDGSNVGYLLQHLESDRVVIGSDFPAARGSAPLECVADAAFDSVREKLATINAQAFLGLDH